MGSGGSRDEDLGRLKLVSKKLTLTYPLPVPQDHAGTTPTHTLWPDHHRGSDAHHQNKAPDPNQSTDKEEKTKG
ncbi:hypothetical protein M0R45_005984 [Rubus argutus]|uniref:Uncharacterized protein n=1 Tax=Rubus argutus TaxID=59490 RepID=A0AAW1YPM8_RUBAR